MKCSKCHAEYTQDEFVKYCYYPYLEPPKPDEPPRMIAREDYQLCFRCNNVFKNEILLLREFLKEDCGTFPMCQPDRNIIEARRKRNLGEAWKDKNGQTDS